MAPTRFQDRIVMWPDCPIPFFPHSDVTRGNGLYPRGSRDLHLLHSGLTKRNRGNGRFDESPRSLN